VLPPNQLALLLPDTYHKPPGSLKKHF